MTDTNDFPTLLAWLEKYGTPIDDLEKIAQAEAMATSVNASVDYKLYCGFHSNPEFREKIFYNSDSEARIPGHIYSEAGKEEYFISGFCEYHFDLVTTPPDEIEEPVSNGQDGDTGVSGE